ncbi:MAG: AAA family ATPase, partial [Clostridia bacterium]|nr:AAA family ATPase [Clostridia bacterium]
MQEAARLAERIRQNLATVLVGKEEAGRLLVAALLAGRHVLVQDVPGTGKTTLVKALARSVGATFARIQFTPDLLPSDLTGSTVYDRATGEFRFRPGPLFHQVVLADEINRASPKTQSSLLECMEERQVTVDGCSYPLPRPFLVLATQNPVEHEGTFPLPEAQLDRFALLLQLGYPDREEEKEVLRRFGTADPLAALTPVASPEDVLRAQEVCRTVHASDPILEY